MVDYEGGLAPFRYAVLQADVIHIERVHRRQLSRPLVGCATVSRLAPAPCSQPPRLCAARDAWGSDLLDAQTKIPDQPVRFGHHAASDAVFVLDVHTVDVVRHDRLGCLDQRRNQLLRAVHARRGAHAVGGPCSADQAAPQRQFGETGLQAVASHGFERRCRVDGQVERVASVVPDMVQRRDVVHVDQLAPVPDRLHHVDEERGYVAGRLHDLRIVQRWQHADGANGDLVLDLPGYFVAGAHAHMKQRHAGVGRGGSDDPGPQPGPLVLVDMHRVRAGGAGSADPNLDPHRVRQVHPDGEPDLVRGGVDEPIRDNLPLGGAQLTPLNLTLSWHLPQPTTAPVVDKPVREEYIDLERIRQLALRDCGKGAYPAARQ